ncbi:MAG: DUF1501 domain-containing protein [Verrucomicrobiales bacterium]|jgi:hypothetical protein|nr:DUF1501 domain-containing protein [Verrucomicrobiales bacterium]|tara:strand:- start:1629 stop:3044 length:1416 start_codon:yes stop_codon:yes gene_type:complete
MNPNRRDFLNWSIQGTGATAFTNLLLKDQAQASGTSLVTHYPAKAKRVIHICLVGGMSHIDSFDPKPHLTKNHGKEAQLSEKPDIFFGRVGPLRRADWEFKARGKSGLMVSEMFPHIAKQADKITVIRSMITQSANHTPALFFENSGFEFNGYPSVGTWVSYGLGAESESLPSYVVLPDGRGDPNGGASNWSNGFLPAQYQGVRFGKGENPIRDLFPAREISDNEELQSRELLNHLNKKHQDNTQIHDLLEARIRSYELAAKMQLSVPEVTDLGGETEQTKEMYGIGKEPTDDCGRRCLLGRRLLEQGVRFVQIFSGGPIGGNPRASWDAHENVKENHGQEAARIDKPIGALLADLDRRGMLDETLVLFTTEFGRTPFAQSDKGKVGPGRDHNKGGFSIWMAGAGLKPGISHGVTDEIGWKTAEDPVTWHDFHATVMHLLGMNHEDLTFYHNGIERRLTNVHGNLIGEILT